MSFYYTESEEWISDDGNVLTIGITNYAQEQLGDVVFVGLPTAGDEFNAGDELVVIESVKAAGGIEALVAGEVVSVNDVLEETPELVNEDPMGAAWIVKVKASEPLPLDQLMSAEQYQHSLSE